MESMGKGEHLGRNVCPETGVQCNFQTKIEQMDQKLDRISNALLGTEENPTGVLQKVKWHHELLVEGARDEKPLTTKVKKLEEAQHDLKLIGWLAGMVGGAVISLFGSEVGHWVLSLFKHKGGS